MCDNGSENDRTRSGIGRDDLDECWCCGGLHDSPGSLCPNCDKADCTHFGDDCESGHQPVLPDGGIDGAAGMTARENLPRDAVTPPERDVDAVTETFIDVSEGQRVKLGIAAIIDGEHTGGTSVMKVHGVEPEPPNFDRRVNLIHHDGLVNRLWITGIGNDDLDPWEIVSAPFDPVRQILDSTDMAFHGWVVGAEVVE